MYLYLYPKGDKSKGIEYLQIAAKNSNKYLSTEGHYFLMKLYLEEMKYGAALTNVNELLQRYPQNAIFMYYKFKIHLKAGNQKEATIVSNQLMSELKNNAQITNIQIKHFEHLIEEDNIKFNKPKRE